jgi:hypothetical protein
MSQTTDRNQQHARSESAELNTQIADAEFLKVFLSLQGEERAARWRMLDHGSKFRLVARQIERLGSDWLPSDVEAQIVKCDARYALGPVEAAVEGALERLAQEHSAAARLATEAGDKAHATAERRTTTAYTNALIEYRRGVRPQLLDSGAWLLPSRRAGEAPHIVTMDGDWVCSCVAHDSMHWPIALVIGCEVAGDMLDASDDGAAESELDAALERTRQTLEAMRLSQRLCAAGRFDLRAA